ncbi:MAG: response regulator [bacterium]|nr:response regulator [bacterium]
MMIQTGVPHQSFTTDQHTILVVGATPSEYEHLIRWLAPHGYVIEQAMDSLEATARVRAKGYRLILIDMDAQDDLGGFETVWLLKTLVWEAKIALICSAITPQFKSKAAALGVLHYLPKPLTKQAAMDEIEQVLLDSSQKDRHPVWKPRFKFWQRWMNR